MPKKMVTRRGFLKDAGVLSVPILAAAGAPASGAATEKVSRPLKVLCVGAHPDDPESGCATNSTTDELG